VTWGPGVEKRLKGLGDAVLLNPLLATEQGKRRAIELVKRAGEEGRRMSKRVKWCGPYALATLTRCTYTEAVDLIRTYRGERGYTDSGRRRPVKSVAIQELSGILGKNEDEFLFRGSGYAYPTLTQWLHGPLSQPRDVWTQYLVLVTGHFIVVAGDLWTDNWCDGAWYPLSECPYKRKRVRGYVRVQP
jgi:hypothetical protein